MKKPLPKNFLKVDKNIQIVLAVLMFCCIVFFPLMGIPFFLLGIWQLVSALYLGIQFKDKIRQHYLLVVLAWGVVMGGMAMLEIYGALWFIFLLLVPLCMAIWYFNRTYTEWKVASKEKEQIDDILDYEIDEL